MVIRGIITVISDANTLRFGEENIDGERPYVNNYADKPLASGWQVSAGSTFSELLNEYSNFFKHDFIMKTKPHSCTPVTKKGKHMVVFI